MITNIEEYFLRGCGSCERFAAPDCAARQWSGGLAELRRICLESRPVETVKWGHPCCIHGDRNIVILGAFRGDFRISFFNAPLMKDPKGILEKQGPNTRHPEMIRFVKNTQSGGVGAGHQVLSRRGGGLRGGGHQASLRRRTDVNCPS